MNWTAFRQHISDTFNKEQLQTLCFDLGVDYDDLAGEGKQAKVRELIAHMRQHGRLPELIAELGKRRPHLDWQALLPAAIPDGQPTVLQVESAAGFVGQTERGPLAPTFVHSWADFVAEFGDGLEPAVSFLTLAVRGFFDNAGRRACIVRVLGESAAQALTQLPTTQPDTFLLVEALHPGVWGNYIQVQIEDGARAGFHLTLTYRPPAAPSVGNGNNSLPAEQYDNLTFAPDGPNDIMRIVNSRSRLVRLHWQGWPGEPARPLNTQIFLAGGMDGTINASQYLGTFDPATEERSGLAALEATDGLSLICLPDHVHPRFTPAEQTELMHALIGHCQRQDRFALFSTPAGQDEGSIQTLPDTPYAALYYPWIRVFDAYTETVVLIPPVGHLAGLYARSDAEQGIHQVPLQYPLLGLAAGSLPLETEVTAAQQAAFARMGINVIRGAIGSGDFRPATAFTLALDERWRFVRTQRFFLFVTQAIHHGLAWTQFERNDEQLWSKVQTQVGDFLHKLWQGGALRGNQAEEAYFVRCDHQTMTQNDIDNGRLVLLLGLSLPEPPQDIAITITLPALPPSD